MTSVEDVRSSDSGFWFFDIKSVGRPHPPGLMINVYMPSEARPCAGFSIVLDGEHCAISHVILEHASARSAYLEAWWIDGEMRPMLFPRESQCQSDAPLPARPPLPPRLLWLAPSDRSTVPIDPASVIERAGRVYFWRPNPWRRGDAQGVALNDATCLSEGWAWFVRRYGRGNTKSFSADYRKRKVNEARSHLARKISHGAIRDFVRHDIRTLRGWAVAEGLPPLE